MYKDIIAYLNVSKGSEAIRDFAVCVASALEAHNRHRNGVCLEYSGGKHGIIGAGLTLTFLWRCWPVDLAQ